MGDSLIEGVLVTPQKRISQPNGDVLHALKRSGRGFKNFGEAYFSLVKEGAIKGWKSHQRVTLNLVVPVGSVRFVIHDDRMESPSAGQFSEYAVGETNHVRLTVPPRLWVAFQGRGPGSSVVLNIADEEHDPLEAVNKALDSIPYGW